MFLWRFRELAHLFVGYSVRGYFVHTANKGHSLDNVDSMFTRATLGGKVRSILSLRQSSTTLQCPHLQKSCSDQIFRDLQKSVTNGQYAQSVHARFYRFTRSQCLQTDLQHGVGFAIAFFVYASAKQIFRPIMKCTQ